MTELEILKKQLDAAKDEIEFLTLRMRNAEFLYWNEVKMTQAGYINRQIKTLPNTKPVGVPFHNN